LISNEQVRTEGTSRRGRNDESAIGQLGCGQVDAEHSSYMSLSPETLPSLHLTHQALLHLHASA
jgi:hypothetical protein